MNLQAVADPVAVNRHVKETVVFRNVIVALWTSLVTGGGGGLRDKTRWKKRELLYSDDTPFLQENVKTGIPMSLHNMFTP